VSICHAVEGESSFASINQHYSGAMQVADDAPQFEIRDRLLVIQNGMRRSNIHHFSFRLRGFFGAGACLLLPRRGDESLQRFAQANKEPDLFVVVCGERIDGLSCE
jgi:hypothetical protein